LSQSNCSAKEDHVAFEAAHVARQGELAFAEVKIGRNLFAVQEAKRTIPLEGDKKLVRRLGE
jgi:hypothetical protein